MNEFDKAKKYAEEALEAAKNISVDDYEKLRPYLEVWFMRPDITEELDLLRLCVSFRLSNVYYIMGGNKKTEKLFSEVYRITKELGIPSELLDFYIFSIE